MAKEFFKDLPNTTTPLTASRLNGLLDGDEAIGKIVVDRIRTKNMFDKNNVIPNCRFGASGEELYDGQGTSGSYFIEVEPSTTYAITNGIDWAQVVCFYDSSKTFIQRINSGGGTTFTTTSATKYIRISVYDTHLATFQLEKGSSSTTYMPYQQLDNKERYTTGETIIGTWIDGKPLYRKVINMGTLVNNTSKSVAHGLSNYVIRSISGAVSNGTFQIPTSGFSDEVYVDASNVIWNTKVNRTSFSGYVILEYTKTTD